MKLHTDFSGLWSAVKKMGAEKRDFDITALAHRDDFRIDAELDGGIDVDLEDLESTGGVLTYKGRQILLYIPDQGWAIRDVLSGDREGKKYHVADCKTLKRMRSEGRFERYIATNNLNGSFEVFGKDSIGRSVENVETELHVCRDCLRQLNYKGYKTGPNKKHRDEIYNNFGLSEFFAKYSTLFPHIPKLLQPMKAGYSADWAQVSQDFRASKNNTCERCQVDLSQHSQLLHCHHLNGVKQDNSASNLRALCMDCHRKEPLHEHMYVEAKAMQTINRVRREQRLMDSANWEDAISFADSAFEGLLRVYHKKGKACPEVGYDIQNKEQSVVATPEIAWPKQRHAVVLDASEVKLLAKYGWSAETLSEAVEQHML